MKSNQTLVIHEPTPGSTVSAIYRVLKEHVPDLPSRTGLYRIDLKRSDAGKLTDAGVVLQYKATWGQFVIMVEEIQPWETSTSREMAISGEPIDTTPTADSVEPPVTWWRKLLKFIGF
jgi:hypothetical protein